MTLEAPGVVAKKKLIEVALPLDAINKASAREKSIRRGHPSTLHLWWARRPLAAARAVIFAQMVDDPSANLDLFPTKRAQERERQRLFRIIEDLVKWENTTNEEVLQRARDEIWQSWRRACADNADHPRAKGLFDRHVLPAFHDPFAGGGSLPLEAQRLGLESHASDLNPVAVLINKAMIEIPPKFSGRPPVNAEARAEKRLMNKNWRGAEGLADDVRYYGRWIRDEAEKRIGHLYPKVKVTAEMAKERPDLAPYAGRDLPVIAWFWARTVRSPNPAFADVHVPLVSTFMLCAKKGREAYIHPELDGDGYQLVVRIGIPDTPDAVRIGTKIGRGANFRCLMSDSPIHSDYVKREGQSGRMKTRLLGAALQGDRRRLYVSPTADMESAASAIEPAWKPDLIISGSTQYIGVKLYGLENFSDLFTSRQHCFLDTLAATVRDSRYRILTDASKTLTSNDSEAYADALSAYMSLSMSRQVNRSSTLNFWDNLGETVQQVFARQALQMTWGFVEANPFSSSTGSFLVQVEYLASVIRTSVAPGVQGVALQQDAQRQDMSVNKVVSTDPPYFDNVPYADLSDFFYVWLRRSLSTIFPELFSTVAVPKAEELVAFAHRHSDKSAADSFFLTGMTEVMRRIGQTAHPAFPTTIYYAFRQSEMDSSQQIFSTGWDNFLEGIIRAGLCVSGTWPVRTEYTSNLKTKPNALASSIVIVCRPRPKSAQSCTRREFQSALRSELPRALESLHRSYIAPADLAQASIGPGMEVFTRFRGVLNADGTEMRVRDALALINATLDEVLAEQEGDFDADSRWALTWFEQHGFTNGEYGIAEQLSKAKNTSVDGLVRAGIVESRLGTVRLYRPDELDPDWDPTADRRPTVWEMTHHLIRALESGGEPDAAVLAVTLGSQAETARDLAYRLYTVSERRKRAADALQYNGLVQSWPEIVRIAGEQRATTATQGALAIDGA